MQGATALNVSNDIKEVLMKHDVYFAFQPIFSKEEEIIGYEALMRPSDKNVLEFIKEMQAENKLHELELLSFFGATMAYKERNYDALLSINSFPEDSFSLSEASEYSQCFRPIKEKLIIELLEYTEEKNWTWALKKQHIDTYKGIQLALDDYGTGNNDRAAVDFYNPNMIKLDRKLISGIDHDTVKQENIKAIVQDMHSNMIAVLAEGIETKEEYEYLKSIDIDFYQGYYLGRPQ